MKLRNRLPVTTSVEKFSHDGRGIARIDGKITFIHGALPHETVSFKYTASKSDYDEGHTLEVLESSPQRAVPPCAHYDECGACSLQHLDEKTQIDVKQSLLIDSLQRIGHVEPQALLEPLTSLHTGYRNKARLSVRFVIKKQEALVGFRERENSRYIANINECAILNPKVGTRLTELKALIASMDDPHAIAQIEVAAGDTAVALIFRNLNELSEADSQKLCDFADAYQFIIYLQPKGPDSVYLHYPKTAPTYLTYSLPDYGITFKFLPTDFTQVNAGLNRLMIARALALMQLESTDIVLDLFCGLGNFSLPMATFAQMVIGIEGSEAMVERASMNATTNGIENTRFYAANLELPLDFPELAHYQFNKLLLDPPRSGAFEIVKNIALINPERIVYVSCNPATLARDSAVLVSQGYILKSAGVMDMFPHTAHVESIALFEKG